MRRGTRKVLVVFGTRPEAIKLCPLIHRLRERRNEFRVATCVTAQHRELLDQVVEAFHVVPDYDLNAMVRGQSLVQCTVRILAGLEQVLRAESPDLVIVQGDTTTTLCGALAAFYSGVPVGHVEAGLRTGDPRRPFPEEMNRVMTSRLASLHFAPTPCAANHLRREGVEETRIRTTGNTGIDAVLDVVRKLDQGRLAGGDWSELDSRRKLIVVTAHRRENFGERLDQICRALVRIAARGDAEIVYPAHPNPNVQRAVGRWLGGRANVHVVEPMEYVPFVDLMRRAHVLVTDSGGIQEEAPSLGKPVLVLRDTTERPEAVRAGTVRLVGTDEDHIVEEVAALLGDDERYGAMSRAHNPYGDGRASERIADAIGEFLGRQNGAGMVCPTPEIRHGEHDTAISS